jgi:hypothetical protein
METPGQPQRWEDFGPTSQGKIITAILQHRPDDATAILRHWTVGDLVTLATAAETLKTICLAEQIRQRRLYGQQ